MRYIKSQASLRQKPKRNLSLGRKRRLRSSADSLSLRYNNPYKTFNRKPLNLRWMKHLILPGLLATWVGLLIYLPFFRVTSFSFSGLKILSSSDLQAAINEAIIKPGILPGNNYFFINEKQLAASLESKFSLNNVTITKTFPNTLAVAVEEKVSSALYNNGTNYYLIDQKGNVLKTVGPVADAPVVAPTSTPTSTVAVTPTTAPSLTPTFQPIIFATTAVADAIITNTGTLELDFDKTTLADLPKSDDIQKKYGDYPIIVDLSKPAVAENKTVLTPAVVSGIIDFYNKLKVGEHLTAEYAIVDDPNAGALAITTKPWHIKFNPASDIDSQIKNLATVMHGNQPTDYIDVRFGDRVYWK